MPLEKPKRIGGKLLIGPRAHGTLTNSAPVGVLHPLSPPLRAHQRHQEVAKRLSPSQVRTLALQRLTEAYGSNWEEAAIQHLWQGGDMYTSLTFT